MAPEKILTPLLPVFIPNDNARTVLEKRYLQPGETPEARFFTVALHVAEAERKFTDVSPDLSGAEVWRWAHRFYERMRNMEFLPNSPTLRNAGAVKGTLSACFVIPIEDSWAGIAEARRQSGWVQKYGGGVGYDFSALRPRGATIGSTQGSACGPVAVLRDFNQLSDTLTQGNGAFRKGANMGILRVDHPDIREFIHVKDGGTSILNFNISVAVPDDFLEALRGDTRYYNEWLSWDCIDHGRCDEGDDARCPDEICHEDAAVDASKYAYPLRFGGEVSGWLDARVLWDEIARSAWETGDPGLFFVDEANRFNPTPHLYAIAATNPCGEVTLGPYEPCNLGSIAVNRFLSSEPDGTFDWSALSECVRDAVRFLDDVVEVNEYPTREIDAASRLTRKIGLGVMGWADALIALGIPYGSTKALLLASDLMDHINQVAEFESRVLAEERGVYPGWFGSDHEADGIPLRNSTRTCLAPTGTISVIAGVSSGIEPYFAVSWMRTMEDGTPLPEHIPALRAWLDSNPDASPPDYFQTAMGIEPYWHVAMQAAFQEHTDLSISKTINMPETASVDDIKAAYLRAAQSGCRGITIYRDKSRRIQVLTPEPATLQHGDTLSTTYTLTQEGPYEPSAEPTRTDPDPTRHHLNIANDHRVETAALTRRPLPRDVGATRHRFEIGGQNGYIHVGFYPDGDPCEVFLTVSKAGSTTQGLVDALSVTLSTAIQHGVPLDAITRKLRNMRFEPAGRTDNPAIPLATSLADYIARYLDDVENPFDVALQAAVYEGFAELGGEGMPSYNEAREMRSHGILVPADGIFATGGVLYARETFTPVNIKEYAGDLCPECGDLMELGEGCALCRACGFSRCG